jgi:hypothetical protein
LLAVSHVSQLRPEADVEDKGDDLAFRRIEQRQIFFRAAGAAAPEDGHAPLFIFAAIGDFGNEPGLLLQFLLAAAGVVGALLGRTAADVAIAGTLAGQGVGQVRTAQSYRCQRTQGDDQIDHHEQLGRELASCCAFEFLHRITNQWFVLSLQSLTSQRRQYYAQTINKSTFITLTWKLV